MTTICAQCKHHYLKDKPPRWHDWECHHPDVEREKVLDVVTGRMEYAHHDQWPNCRDVNKGDCELFQISVAAKAKGLVSEAARGIRAQQETERIAP